MPQRDGAQADAVFDELVAVHVPRVRALAPHDEARRLHRKLVVALGVGVGAARNDAVGFLTQRVAAGARSELGLARAKG